MKDQKFIISGLLAVGFLALIAAVSPVFNPNPNVHQRNITWGGLGIGTICFGLAGYLVWQIKSPREESGSMTTVIPTQTPATKRTSQPTVIQTETPAPKDPESSALITKSQPTSAQKQLPISKTNKIFDPLNADLLHSLATALKQQQWQEADRITAQLMLKAANQTVALTPKDLAHFPCQSLSEIDRLWQIYSQNQFGFLAQVEVFNDCFSVGNFPSSLSSENWQKYAQHLGWYVGQWPNHHQELKFYLTAPKGHLPFLPVWQGAWWGGFLAGQGERFYTFLKQVQSCQLGTHLNPEPINNQAQDPQNPLTALGEKSKGMLRADMDSI